MARIPDEPQFEAVEANAAVEQTNPSRAQFPTATVRAGFAHGARLHAIRVPENVGFWGDGKGHQRNSSPRSSSGLPQGIAKGTGFFKRIFECRFVPNLYHARVEYKHWLGRDRWGWGGKTWGDQTGRDLLMLLSHRCFSRRCS